MESQFEDERNNRAPQSQTFVENFLSSPAPRIVILVMILFAIGMAAPIGVVPGIMEDRFARLNHGYSSEVVCSTYSSDDKPQACIDGATDAFNARAQASFVSSALTFVSSPLIGSISDEYGRRGIILLGLVAPLINSLSLVLLQIMPTMSPTLYFAASASSGLIGWVSISIAALSDVVAPQWRAASFGMLLAAFSLGFAIAPSFALFLDIFWVTVIGFGAVFVSFLTCLIFLPETVPPELAAKAARDRRMETSEVDGCNMVLWVLLRPVREMSILNRDKLFRILSVLAFFSGVVSAGDQNLLTYYLEANAGFTSNDLAYFLLEFGLFGLLTQGFLLKPLNALIGERNVICVAFLSGTILHFIIGLAKQKWLIFVGGAMSALAGLAYPTISAIKSNNVENSEQGQIQGALYSVQALAQAGGPLFMQFIYKRTKDGEFLGAGTMWICAGLCYFFGIFFALMLPSKKTDSGRLVDNNEDSLLEPLSPFESFEEMSDSL